MKNERKSRDLNTVKCASTNYEIQIRNSPIYFRINLNMNIDIYI